MATLVAATAAVAQTYPSKPIRLIVGPGSDVVMRAMAQVLSVALKTSVVVEQMPGAGGVIAAQTVARAAPDGYTLMTTTGATVINDVLRRSASYSVLRDFEPVALVAVGPGLLMVPASLPVKTLPEFMKLATDKPDTLNCASSGIGTPPHLGCAMLATYGKVVVQHVPYNGLGPAMVDLMAGRVQLVFALLSGSLIHDPKLRVIAITSTSRDPALPEVPTVAESGLPQLEQFRGWNGVHAPKGTPKEVIARLAEEIGKALAVDDVKQKIAASGLAPASPEASATAAFAQFVKGDIERWTKVVADTGAQPE